MKPMPPQSPCCRTQPNQLHQRTSCVPAGTARSNGTPKTGATGPRLQSWSPPGPEATPFHIKRCTPKPMICRTMRAEGPRVAHRSTRGNTVYEEIIRMVLSLNKAMALCEQPHLRCVQQTTRRAAFGSYGILADQLAPRKRGITRLAYTAVRI